MTIYHGSDQIIKTPELRNSIKTLDFGPGFYKTSNKEQAIDFSKKVYERTIRTGRKLGGKFVSIKVETIAKLKVRKLFDQISFVSERSLSFLKFINFMEIPDARHSV